MTWLSPLASSNYIMLSSGLWRMHPALFSTMINKGNNKKVALEDS